LKSNAANVDEYLAEVPEGRREVLVVLRALIREVAPEATEGIEYGMPCFYRGGKLLFAMASQKNYMALYGCTENGIEQHREALGKLNCGKGCIRFQRLEQLPMGAIADILRTAVGHGE